MTARTHASFFAALALAACAAPVYAPAPGSAPAGLSPEAAVATITPQDIYARVEFLSADAMRGRDTPSPGLEIAANYLVSQYRLMGLQPGGEGGTFFQWYPYPLRRLNAEQASLDVASSAGTTRLVMGRDFFTAGGTAAPIAGA